MPVPFTAPRTSFNGALTPHRTNVLLQMVDTVRALLTSIEANGGELEGEFVLDFYDKPIRRYWIGL